MRIQVKFFVNFGELKVQTVDLKNGSSARDLTEQLAIPLEEVGLLSVNGRQTTFDRQLQSGDVVVIVPPIGGG